MMKKTLILVVDRDDDFGVKGKVDSPVIGVEECSVAATALGIADPEDSDINALYAAINIYKEMKDEHEGEVEVALICGNQKVGYKSDSAIIDELEIILEKINPTRIILVGDGAEDEYVYPIISSRVPIDSVRKVYVKQAPGLEGTVYIISKIMEDPGKRKRFLAPLAWIIILISLVYMTPSIIDHINKGTSFSNVTTPMVVLLIGFVFLLYAYNLEDSLSRWKTKWTSRLRNGSITVTFLLVSILFLLSGLVIGWYSLEQVYTTNILQEIIWFVSNALWFMIFGILIYKTGDLIDRYISTKKLNMSFVFVSINVVAMGLIATGSLDLAQIYLKIGINNSVIAILEL
ncbi:MAG: DUF373 family protein, partial [Candidatus Methanomethylophilaceae archaeon]|nr:DUF373 family protein [Candidatus Methanomethylophilaceae archaeon]